jgi:hypothetical protein
VGQYLDGILKRLGFNSYAEYLEGDLWKGIRRKFLSEKPRCSICGKKSTHVRFTTFSEAIFSGKDTDTLFPLCGNCFYRVEFDRNGVRRRLIDANQYIAKQLRRKKKLSKEEAKNLTGYCGICGDRAPRGKRICLPCKKKAKEAETKSRIENYRRSQK